MKQSRFNPKGHLALEPKAFGMIFMIEGPPEAENRDGVSLVPIRGPLMHHEDWCFDSYDAIRTRITAQIATKPKAIVMSIDSPGGLVSGCFDAARAIRQECDAAEIPLYAYVDGCAASAAYALACVASRVIVPPTGMVGSIGVIDALVDATAQDAMVGLQIRMIASGARKTDGNPHTPINDAAVAATQKTVDYLASIFFEHVAAHRGVAPEALRALEAGIFTGADALAAGLADDVMTLEEVLAFARGDTNMTTKADKSASTYEDAIAGLKKMAEGEGDDAEKAKTALKALEPKDDADKGDDKDAKADADAPPPPSDEKKDKKDDEDKKDGADAKAIAQRALATAEDTSRRQLLASRTDLPAELVATLSKSSTPLAVVRDIIDTHPRRVAAKPNAAAEASGTRGEGQGSGTASRLPPDEAYELDVRMGLVAMKPTTVNEGNTLILGAMRPVTGKGA